jgi:hypothetical protein
MAWDMSTTSHRFRCIGRTCGLSRAAAACLLVSTFWCLAAGAEDEPVDAATGPGEMLLSPDGHSPEVSNVVISPNLANSHLLNIEYDLTDPQDDPCAVWILVSQDAGQTWDLPAKTFVNGSDVGPGVLPGIGKLMIWDSAADIPGISGTMRIRVLADDGVGASVPSQLGNSVFVPAGLIDGTTTMVPAAWIDRNPVTNRQYCDFLNQADPTGYNWNIGMRITKHGTAYAVKDERADMAADGLSAADQQAYLDWLSLRLGLTCRAATANEWTRAIEEYSFTGSVGFRVSIPADQ